MFPCPDLPAACPLRLAPRRYLRLGKVTRVMRNHRLLDKIGSFNDVTVNAALLGLKVCTPPAIK